VAAPGKLCQGVTQVRVDAFYSERLALTERDLMRAVPAKQRRVHVEPIAEVAGSRCLNYDRLHCLPRALYTDAPADDAVRSSVYGCADVNHVFLCPTKVCSSSISTTARAFRRAAGGRASAALTQLATG